MRFDTQAVHIGVDADASYNSVTTPIYPTSTFRFDAIGKNRGYDYSRTANPTRAALEKNLSALESGAGASITTTGMAAITSVMFLFKPGDHIVAGHDIYGGSYRLFSTILRNLGYQFSFVDMREPKNVSAALRDNTRAVWIETPSNPLMNLVDIAAVAEIARRRGVRAIADNTFLSPYLQKPLRLGCDVVVHSTTKYINGHSDVVGGAIIAKTAELAQRIAALVNALGTACSPFDAFLVLRGVKTLGPRMQVHERNARALAEFLVRHPKVKRVYYPGLPDHPQHDLAKRQASGFGGMLSCDVQPSVDLNAFFAKLQVFSLAESLGGVESLIEQPWTMSHASMPEKARVEAGISPQTVRLSTGIEDADDLIEDLARALG